MKTREVGWRVAIAGPARASAVLALVAWGCASSPPTSKGREPLVVGSPGSSGSPAAEQECRELLRQGQTQASNGHWTEARRSLEEGQRRCPKGHGFAVALGDVLVHEGQFDAAADAYKQEVTGMGSDPIALERLHAIHPRLSPEKQAFVSMLGSWPATPLHLPDIRDRDAWIRDVSCRGQPLKGLLVHAKQNFPDEVDVECPAGVRHTLYLVLDHPLPGPSGVQLPGTPEVDAVVPLLGERFGIQTRAELKEALAGVEPSRGSAWLLSWVGDEPRLAASWEAVLAEDPNDLSAVIEAATAEWRLGDTPKALATLARTPLARLEVRDTRDRARRPSVVPGFQCQLLRLGGKLAEAERACEDAIEMGSHGLSRLEKAKLDLLAGRWKAAVDEAEQYMSAHQNQPESHFLRGAAQLGMGYVPNAKAEWGWSLHFAPGYTPASRALRASAPTPAELVRWMDEADTEASALEFAKCAHVYLDLGLPEQSSVCLAHAERLAPGLGAYVKVSHALETDSGAALALGLEAAQKSRHPRLLAAVGLALWRQGKSDEAKRWLAEAVEAAPVDAIVKATAEKVCPGADCLAQFHDAHP